VKHDDPLLSALALVPHKLAGCCGSDKPRNIANERGMQPTGRESERARGPMSQ
jgi:hypothetical protein